MIPGLCKSRRGDQQEANGVTGLSSKRRVCLDTLRTKRKASKPSRNLFSTAGTRGCAPGAHDSALRVNASGFRWPMCACLRPRAGQRRPGAEGKARREIVNMFGISLPTLKRYLKHQRETGNVLPKPILGRTSKKFAPLETGLVAYLKAHSDVTLEDHCPRDAQRDGAHQQSGFKASFLALLLLEGRTISDPCQ
jgi:hypothetical protein